MPDSQRELSTNEHIIAEQGLLNLVLQADLQLLHRGRDLTPSLKAQAERINRQFDQLDEWRQKINEAAIEQVRQQPAFRDPANLMGMKPPTPATMPKHKTEPAVPKAKRPARKVVKKAPAKPRTIEVGDLSL